ncbi:phosphoglycolate phosphatase [Sulfurimonas paralvinellae]|uniref:phosphoglycolate phosphatase n=1 Tax=Sulfurimonas paralvinellae TaxID=317658 RepID=A0A7M1B7C3_9BACT|nr:phosphoglycolate phosphatase [Sulfurimonas paralvinellae]QOP45604.1 phosphoglycolate phosphatase [Sulfurimonas paralvinellae]
MIKLTDKKLILFDLDGTLIDSVPDLAASVNYMMRSLRLEPYSVEQIRSWVGNGASTLVKRALAGEADISNVDIGNNFFEEALDLFLDHYSHNLAKETYLYEGVKETLDTLYKRDFIMTIVTNKPCEFIEPILDALEIKEYFSLLLGANSLEKKKPNPEVIFHTLEKFNIKKYESVIVGDSKNDIIAAHNAGIDSLAVTYGYNYEENIQEYDPTGVVDRFEKLTEIIG